MDHCSCGSTNPITKINGVPWCGNCVNEFAAQTAKPGALSVTDFMAMKRKNAQQQGM